MNWTTNPDGSPVNWTEKPYRNDKGIMSFLLPGEDMQSISTGEHTKRIKEYYLILQKKARRIADSE